MGVLALVGVGAPSATGGSPPTVVYAGNTSPTTITGAPWEGGVLGSAGPIASILDDARYVTLAHHASGGSALLATDADGVLRLSTLADGAWDSGQTLATSVGSLASELAVMGFESQSGDLLIVYRSASSSSLRFRTRSAGVLSGESMLDLGLSSAPDQMVLAASPSADRLMLLARAGSALVASEWNGSAFGSASTITSSSQTTGRSFDVAYEATSGHALAVRTSGGVVAARHWDGSAWGADAPMITTSGTSTVVRAVPAPAAVDQVVVLVARTNGSLVSRVWTGTAWGTSQTFEQSAGHRGVEQRFDAAWTPDGASAIVAWARPSAGLLRRRTWSATGWSPESTGPTFSTDLRRLRLVSSTVESTILAAAHLQASTLSASDYVVYAESTLTQGTATIDGVFGASVAGIDLPSAPSSSSGIANLSYGSNQTINLAPGSYQDCTFGDSCTINLTAGTYRFKTFDLSILDNITINADTSGGDVEFILTDGNLAPQNSFTAANTGTGVFDIHILSGNVDAGTNAVLCDVNIIAYNGSIKFGSGLSARATLRASSNVELSSGAIAAPFSMVTSPGPLSMVEFTGSSAGSATTVTSALHGSPHHRAFDVGVPAAGSGLSILRWTQADPNANE